MPRLTVYPEFIGLHSQFLDDGVRPYVLACADASFLARDDQWFSGTEVTPPSPPTQTRRTSEVEALLLRYRPGYELDASELTTLFGARGADFNAVVDAADQVRRDLVGDDVTFVINRNINYTNVCTFKCRFCAFSKGPLSLNLRGDPYLLELEEISERVVKRRRRVRPKCVSRAESTPSSTATTTSTVAAVRAAPPPSTSTPSAL